jgi:hypothetical protein
VNIVNIVDDDTLYSYYPVYAIPEVSSINHYGIVSITFNERMKSLKNYSSVLNNPALDLSIMNNKQNVEY